MSRARRDGPSYVDLESAIMGAEGAAAVVEILETTLTARTDTGFKVLRIEPRDDLCVTALTPREDLALTHARAELVAAVREVARTFYAAVEGGTLWPAR